MRKITAHIANPANDKITIEVGAGGAYHHYKIGCLEADWSQHIEFQNGPIAEVGVNGITKEALLAIVIDRLRCFQAGPYDCDENAEALAHAEQSLNWLKSRTTKRIKLGVEGTSKI